MKLFFAACDISCQEIWSLEVPQNILLSYAYPRELSRTLEYCKANQLCSKIDLILDSGAFSAWNVGAIVDIEKYLRKIEEIKKKYAFRSFYPVNLDVIPGKQGETITAQQSEEAMLAGWKNYLWLKERGAESIHVFHQGEDFKFLLNTIVPLCSYIGVSPSNDSHLNQKIAWCKDAFHLLTNKTKSHGFAVTSEKLLGLFPWYSVDSASWKLGANLGKIYLSTGQYYYSTQGKEVNFEGIMEKKMGEEGVIKEIRSLPIPDIKEMTDEELIHQLKRSYKIRRQVNYFYFKNLQDKHTKEAGYEFRDTQADFFRDALMGVEQ